MTMRYRGLLVAAMVAAAVQAQEVHQPAPGPGPSEPEPRPQPTLEPSPLSPTDAGLLEPVAEPAPSAAPLGFAHLVEATGYLAARGGFTRSQVSGLVPTDGLPQLGLLAELNGQVKVKYLERSFVYGDVSLIFQTGGSFRGRDATTGLEVELPEKNVPALQPAVSLNELYLLHELDPAFNVLVGRKRLVWGSGQAYNPTDLLNIRKDPTDPTGQRAGAWMVRLEVPLETMAFTAVFAPGLLKQVNGLAQALLMYPDWDKKDDQAHYLLALRAYALVADADVNLMLFFSNLYGDAFTEKVRLGASFSRYFFTDYELHAELLLGTGSGRDYLNHDCALNAMGALQCFLENTPFLSKSKLGDAAYYPKLLVGTRRQFADESMLSVEYLYQAEGLSKAEFQDRINALDLIDQAKTLGVPPALIPNLSPEMSSDGVPSRFTFDPQAQHYLFLSYSKPRIFDDFTAQLVTIVNLDDLSSIWSPSISWSATQSLTLSALGFIPVRGLDSLGATRPTGGERLTEYGISPVAYRFLLEARLFY